MRESGPAAADMAVPKPADGIANQPPSDALKTPNRKAARRQRWKARRKSKLEDLKMTGEPPILGASGAPRVIPKPWAKSTSAPWPRKGKKGGKGKSKGKGKGKQKGKRK